MIKIHFFAALTNMFPRTIDMNIGSETTIADVFETLKQLKPEAAGLLMKSRAAINENIVELSSTIEDLMEVFIIPPSSGG